MATSKPRRKQSCILCRRQERHQPTAQIPTAGEEDKEEEKEEEEDEEKEEEKEEEEEEEEERDCCDREEKASGKFLECLLSRPNHETCFDFSKHWQKRGRRKTHLFFSFFSLGEKKIGKRKEYE